MSKHCHDPIDLAAAGFNVNPLSDFLQCEESIPESLRSPLDDLCHAWNARWTLQRSKTTFDDPKILTWKVESIRRVVRFNRYP